MDSVVSVFCYAIGKADKEVSCSTNRTPLSVELLGLGFGVTFNGSCRTGDSRAICGRNPSSPLCRLNALNVRDRLVVSNTQNIDQNITLSIAVKS